jgi:DNA mismatch repair ATPase MutL
MLSISIFPLTSKRKKPFCAVLTRKGASFFLFNNQQYSIQLMSSVNATNVKVRGLISKFAVGAGRTGSDRQYFFINGRPCNPGKVIFLLPFDIAF